MRNYTVICNLFIFFITIDGDCSLLIFWWTNYTVNFAFCVTILVGTPCVKLPNMWHGLHVYYSGTIHKVSRTVFIWVFFGWLWCNNPQGKLTGYILKINVWMNKEKFPRAGFEPVTCRCSTYWANQPYIGGLPILSISLFRGTVRSTMYCPLARDHAQVTIQPGKRQ